MHNNNTTSWAGLSSSEQLLRHSTREVAGGQGQVLKPGQPPRQWGGYNLPSQLWHFIIAEALYILQLPGFISRIVQHIHLLACHLTKRTEYYLRHHIYDLCVLETTPIPLAYTRNTPPMMMNTEDIKWVEKSFFISSHCLTITRQVITLIFLFQLVQLGFQFISIVSCLHSAIINTYLLLF